MMNIEEHEQQPASFLPRGALGSFWAEGVRTLCFMRPGWEGLRATPGVVAALVAVALACGVLIERLFFLGGAAFHWPSLLGTWFPTALALWTCWLVADRASIQGGGQAAQHLPSAADAFALLTAQAASATIVAGLAMGGMVRADGFAQSALGQRMISTAWIVLTIWLTLAQVAVLWRSGMPRLWPRVAAVVLLVAGVSVQMWAAPARHWYALPDADGAGEEAAYEPPHFTQEEIELQSGVLERRLKAVQPLKKGQAGVYAITFAPYGEEDVFRRESELVASLMQQRFGAAGRTLQLVNHRGTLDAWPWATPLNLRRAIQHLARTMKRDEDVLFIHLTSHGASNGELAAAFPPLSVEPVTPGQLRAWLDEAGIRWRVISISACYSGSWIPQLAGPNTLVMTAADADHTSYGCGKRSELTFFGRAMYDEELRKHHSFEQAHAAARKVIDRREKEAGKTDGYSNPQISVGPAIRERLKSLEQSLSK